MGRLSISEAARRCGVSRQTIHKHAAAGRITIMREGDAPEIDEAELFRVYGDKFTPLPDTEPVTGSQQITPDATARLQAMELELQAARQAAAQREEMLQWFKKHCDTLAEQLSAAQRQLEHRPPVAPPATALAPAVVEGDGSKIIPPTKQTLWQVLRTPFKLW